MTGDMMVKLEANQAINYNYFPIFVNYEDVAVCRHIGSCKRTGIADGGKC